MLRMRVLLMSRMRVRRLGERKSGRRVEGCVLRRKDGNGRLNEGRRSFAGWLSRNPHRLRRQAWV